MKKLPKYVIAAAIAVVLLATVVIGNAVSDKFLLGELFSKSEKQQDSNVVAEVNGAEITLADIEREIKMYDLMNSSEKRSEAEILDDLILKQVLLAEAEKLGLLATPEEIEAFIAEQKKFYEEDVEVASTIDGYCKGANITLEEYWKDFEERAPRVIARTKLANNFSNEYCEKNGLDQNGFVIEENYDKFKAEYEKYQKALLEKYKEYIIYDDTDKISSDKDD
jgi:hypothetical protein